MLPELCYISMVKRFTSDWNHFPGPVLTSAFQGLTEQLNSLSDRKMYTNEPEGYLCPFCLLASGIDDERVAARQSDIVFQDDQVIAFICAKQWPNNKGHVLVVPVKHYENIYDLPVQIAARIHQVARETALAMKEVYGCPGISTRQHNEPAGNQEVWHYHLHVFPRYHDDNLYGIEDGEMMDVEDRSAYACLLRRSLNSLYADSPAPHDAVPCPESVSV
jgi:histidine triad (HIT) family protein